MSLVQYINRQRQNDFCKFKDSLVEASKQRVMRPWHLNKNNEQTTNKSKPHQAGKMAQPMWESTTKPDHLNSIAWTYIKEDNYFHNCLQTCTYMCLHLLLPLSLTV